MSSRWSRYSLAGLLATTGLIACFAGEEVRKTGTDNGWKQHDIHRPKPIAVKPPNDPAGVLTPNDAVVLLDGTNLDAWESTRGGSAEWKLAEGAMEIVPGKGAIRTKGKFGDVQLHVEWASPSPAKGTGQDRGNTGLFLMSRYEIQILDSYQADTYADGQAGALYGQYPPLFNASRPPGVWQTYDIAFRRPRFAKDGSLVEPARATLFHNGLLVQNNEELLGQTTWLKWQPYEAHEDAAPIELQDHGHAVKFRNMWLRNLPERAQPTAEALKKPEIVTLSEQALDQIAGQYVMGSKANGTRVSITKAQNHLLVKLPFLPTALVIEPTAPLVFTMPHTDGQFTFKEDANHKITGATFQIGDGERAMTKVEK